jgi:hypothetical protein
MATKKKTRKKLKKSKSTAVKKRTAPRQRAKKDKAPKKLAKNKIAQNKATKKQAAAKTTSKKKTAPRQKPAGKKQTQANRQRVETRPLPRQFAGLRSGEQAGDLQGLSRREEADSQSVDELLEEGNAFEAEVIEGVEDAGDQEGREVHTHEVPEDDVPEEYLDRDKD